MLLTFKDNKVIVKNLFKIAIPTAIEAFLFQLVTFSDNFMISFLGSSPLSGVSFASKLSFIFMILIFGISSAFNAYISQAYAKGKYKQIREAFAFLISFGFFLSIIFFIIVNVFTRELIGIFTNESDTLNFGILYLKWVSLIYIFNPISFLSMIALKNINKLKFSLILTTLTVINNIILNYIFIFTLNMGVKGAALATIISKGGEFCMYLYYVILRGKSFYHLSLSDFKFSQSLMRELFKLIVPVFSHEFVWLFGVTSLNAFYGTLGSAKYASFAVAWNILELAFVVFQGTSVAAALIIGNSIGYYSKERVKSIGEFMSLIGVLIGLVITFILLISAYIAPHIFTKLEERELVKYLLIVFSFMVIFKGFVAQTLVGIFRASGAALSSFLIESSITIIYTIPIAYYLVFYSSLSFVYIVLIVSFEELIKSVLCIFTLFKLDWIKDIKYDS